MKVTFSPAAQHEHLAQIEYYESQQRGLGNRYLSEVSDALNSIAESPTQFPVVRTPHIRRFVLRRFPFSIIFRAIGENIEILAVAAHRRAPVYWATDR